MHGVSVGSASRETIAGVFVFQRWAIMRNVIAHSILKVRFVNLDFNDMFGTFPLM